MTLSAKACPLAKPYVKNLNKKASIEPPTPMLDCAPAVRGGGRGSGVAKSDNDDVVNELRVIWTYN